MKKLLILFVIAFTINVNAQESALLRLNYKKGDVYKVEVSQNISSTQMNLDMKMTSKLSIINVDGDVYNSESRFTKVVVDLMQGANVMSYDSSKSDDELDQMGLMMKSQMSPMLEAVVSVKGNNLGKVLEAKTSVDFQGSENLGQSNVVYPKNAVRVGDIFKVEQSSQGLTMTMTFTVKSISSKKVVLSLVSSDIAEVKGTMTIDRDSGTVLSSEITTKIEAQGMITKITSTTTKM